MLCFDLNKIAGKTDSIGDFTADKLLEISRKTTMKIMWIYFTLK